MTIAVMQPYIFPYIGYFQMINAVDKFIFYDDVNFIKQGWVNRNKILVSNKDHIFTLPLKNASSFILISETLIGDKLFDKWKLKFLQTLELSYKKAPYFYHIFPIIKKLLEDEYKTICSIAIKSVKSISEYIGINTEFAISSETFDNRGMERQDRLIDICKKENATHYINALGGKELYNKDEFLKDGIKLDFIKTLPIEYKQFNNDFVPWLSIIDVLMFNSKEEIKTMLNKYELI